MPAQLILMNPSRPGAARRARLGSAVKRALARAGARGNPSPAQAHAHELARHRALIRKDMRLAETAKFVQTLADAGLSPAQIDALVRRKFNRPAAKKAAQAAGSPRTNPKEKKMASRKHARKNPRKYARKNPTKKGNKTVRERLEGALAALGMLTPEAKEAVIKAIAPGRRAAGPKKPRVYKRLTEEEKAARAAARKLQSAGTGTQSRANIMQLAMARAQGRISGAEFSQFVKAAGLGKGKKKQVGVAFRKARRAPTQATAALFGPAHEFAFNATRKSSTASKGVRRVSKAYLSAKRALQVTRKDPVAQSVAKELGLTSLPNGSIIKSIKSKLPMAAFAAGGIVLVGWGVSKILPQVLAKVSPTMQKWVAPGLALAVGIGGGALMQKYKSLAKYSGAVMVGGVAIATVALLNSTKDAAGASLASKVAPGLLSIGDYHMGLSVGSYHMGDYHMGAVQFGAIDEVTARRQLAPAGQPMPRHDTRRDGVDASIEQFNGTLAGDIFDQA